MFDREYNIRFTLADIGKFLCFSPILVALVYILICLPWSSADAPAWVQAVGSVLAIAAAVLISQREAVSRRDERVDGEFLYLNKAHAIAVYGVNIVTLAAEYIEEGEPTVQMLNYHATLLSVALGDLEAVDAMRLESEPAVHAYLSIKRGVVLTRSTIQNAIADNGSFNSDQVADWKKHMADQLAEMRAAILAFVQSDTRLWDRLPT